MDQLDTIKQVPSKPDSGCENLATENAPLLSWCWILGSQVNSSAPVGRVNNTRPKLTFPKVPLGNLQASDLWHWHFVKLVHQGEKQGSQHMSTYLTPCCLIISTITAWEGLTRDEGRSLKQSVKRIGCLHFGNSKCTLQTIFVCKGFEHRNYPFWSNSIHAK